MLSDCKASESGSRPPLLIAPLPSVLADCRSAPMYTVTGGLDCSEPIMAVPVPVVYEWFKQAGGVPSFWGEVSWWGRSSEFLHSENRHAEREEMASLLSVDISESAGDGSTCPPRRIVGRWKE